MVATEALSHVRGNDLLAGEASKFGGILKDAYSARRHYFSETVDGDNIFENYSNIPPMVLKMLGEELNSKIKGGEEIVIFEVPHDGKLAKIQIMNADRYARIKILPHDLHMAGLEDDILGDFSADFSDLGFKDGTLSINVKGDNGAKLVHSTVWSPADSEYDRFTILSGGKGHWDKLLDFRWGKDGLPAAWKVNRAVISHQTQQAA